MKCNINNTKSLLGDARTLVVAKAEASAPLVQALALVPIAARLAEGVGGARIVPNGIINTSTQAVIVAACFALALVFWCLSAPVDPSPA